jgi:hypothetical protein
MVPVLVPEVTPTRLRKLPTLEVLATQLRVPEPALVMVHVWFGGGLPPKGAMNVKEAQLTAITGGGVLTVSVTAMFCGLFETPLAETCMLPL